MIRSNLLCSLTVVAAFLVVPGCAAPKRFDDLGIADSPNDHTRGEISSGANKEASEAVSPVSFVDEQMSALINETSQAELRPTETVELEQPEIGSGLTLPALEQLALSNNPAILQASHNISKARGVRLQVGLKPNPTIGYFGEEIGNVRAGGLHGGFVSQTLVRGGKLHWNQQVLDRDVAAMDWHLETQRQRVLTDVRVAFFQALTAQQRIRLAEEFRVLAEQAVAVAAEQFDAKIGTLPDVLQSEIQLNEVELSVREAKYNQAAAWKELASLTGVVDFDGQELTGSFSDVSDPGDEESVFASIVAASPQLAAANARVNRARANLQRQRVQAIPNVTAQVGGGGDDATGDAFANVQVSVPIPIHNQNQGNVRAAHAEYCVAVQNVERLRSQIRRDLARTMREYNVANAVVERYETAILPRASKTMELMKEGREAGEFDFLRVLTARRAYFEANLNYVDALGKRAQAVAKLDGMLLTDGLSNTVDFNVGDDLRGQALNGQ